LTTPGRLSFGWLRPTDSSTELRLAGVSRDA
jgi:hypothetical protein